MKPNKVLFSLACFWLCTSQCHYAIAVEAIESLSKVFLNKGGAKEIDVKREAKSQTDDGIFPRFKSDPKPPPSLKNPELVTFEGFFIPATPTTEMAIFSDDGCNVFIDGKIVHEKLKDPQHLPTLKQSFFVIKKTLTSPDPFKFNVGQVYMIKVEYSNIIHPNSEDIDGCALFAYLGGGSVSRITLTADADVVCVGESVMLTATVINADGTKAIGQDVKFETDNKRFFRRETNINGIAPGTFSPKTPGKRLLTASSPGFGSASLMTTAITIGDIVINPVNPAGITIDPNGLSDVAFFSMLTTTPNRDIEIFIDSEPRIPLNQLPDSWTVTATGGTVVNKLFWKRSRGQKSVSIITVKCGSVTKTARVIINDHHIELIWETSGTNFPIDDHPAIPPNGGKRIFPGKKTPNDKKSRERGRVNLTAKLHPVGFSKTVVFFNNFDVDDPSTNAAPVDPNGPKGEDNRAPGFFKNGVLIFEQSFVQMKASGTFLKGTIEFRVDNAHPGDNYRIAASTNELFVENLMQKEADEGSANPDVFLSPMLTVWRKLHVEIDRMRTPTTLGQLPDIGNFSVSSVTNNLPVAGQSTIKTFGAISAPSVDFYEGGQVIQAGRSFRVISNTKNRLFSDTIVIQGVPNPATLVNRLALLHDDDSPFITAPPRIITPFVLRAYGRAYIEPVKIEAEFNKDQLVNFDTSISNVGSELGLSELDLEATTNSGFAAGFNVKSERLYWTQLLVMCYQPNRKDAGDPDEFPNTAVGVNVDCLPIAAAPFPACRPGTFVGPRYADTVDTSTAVTAIYTETIRDQMLTGPSGLFGKKTDLDHIVAHELGHGPTGPGDDHLEGGIMNVPPHIGAKFFGNSTLVRFRETEKW